MNFQITTKSTLKKIWNYSTNGILVLIVLILLIPSWRIQFQSWFQGFFMSDLTFTKNTDKTVPASISAWELTKVTGSTTSFKEFYKKPIVLSFWTTWCPSCRTELKELAKLNTIFKDDLHIVAVSDEPIETIKQSELHLDCPFIYAVKKIPAFFNIKAYPTLFIIDQQQVVFKHEGAGGLDSEKNILFLSGLIENK